MKHRVYDTFHEQQSGMLIRLCLLIAVFYTAWAFAQYQTVYLQGKGMSSSYIGTLNAITSLLAIFLLAIVKITSFAVKPLPKIAVRIASAIAETSTT